MGRKADLSREAKLIYITVLCRMENGISVSRG